jgi:hypothetical protein
MSVEKNRALLKGLLLACPFELARHDCPLGHLRTLPKERRLAIADAMEPHEIEEHLLNHRNCLMERRKTRTPINRPKPSVSREQRI